MTGSCGKSFRNFEDYLSSSKYIGTIYQSWVKSLPSDLRLSKSLRNVRLPIGLIVQFSALAMFLFFFITGIETSQNASFLSLDKTAGDCSDVKISISDTFYVDYNGYWSTSPYYDESTAMIQLQFIGVEMNQDEYNSLIKDIIYPYLKGLNMENKNWIENYLIWSKSDVVTFDYGGGKVILRIQGDSFSYSNDYYIQTCDLTSGVCTQQYSSASQSQYTVSFDTFAFSSMMKSYSMNSAIPYVDPKSSTEQCDIEPDNSVASSGPIGYGIDIYMPDNSGGTNDYAMKPYTLSSSNSKITTPWTYNYLVGGDITGSYCTSSFNPAVTYLYFPIIGTGLFDVALDSTTNTYYNTLSANSDDCNVCSTATSNPDCNDPTKLSAYVGLLKLSYPSGVQCKTLDSNTGVYSDCAFEDFYTQKAIDNRDTLNQKLFSLIDIMNTNYNINTLKNDATLQEYLNFDAIETVQLTQLTTANFGVYQRLNKNGGLTAGDVQLSCSDSLGALGPFRPDAEAYTTPPTQLTEKYFVCTPSQSTAFLDSFGIASSNTATFMGIFLTIVITGYITWVKYTTKNEITAVSGDDVESQIEMLGVALVNRSATRDKKLPLPSGVISSISDELIKEEEEIESGHDVELSSVQNPYLKQMNK
jgi:hypothetical protein